MTIRPRGSSPIGLLLLAILYACTMPADIELIEVQAGSDSIAPNLAVGNSGSVVLSWLEPDGADHVLKFSVLNDFSWETPRTVARGDNWFVNWADFPSVVPITDTFWASHWLVRRTGGGYAYDVAVAASHDSGQSWSEPVTPHRDGTDTEHGFVSMFPHDSGVGLIWLDGRNMVHEPGGDVAASAMTLRAAVLSPDLALSNELLVDELICDCCQTDVALTSEGPIAVYRDRTAGEIRDIYVSKYRNNRWHNGQPVAHDNWVIPGCPVNGPAIDANAMTVAVAWFTGADNLARVRVRFSDDAANSFSAPIDVTRKETLGRVGVALLPDGDVAVSWLRKTGTESLEVCARRVSIDGQMGPVHVVSGTDKVSSFSVPQMIRTGNNLVFAWTSLDDKISRIVSVSVSVDSL